MKNYTQVYVNNSIEAAGHYCRAFGAEIGYAVMDDSKTAYIHCELNVGGEGFLALGETKGPCDVAAIHKMKWETMTFNAFEMGSEENVRRALDVLSDGGVVIEGIHELSWSKCCATVIDRYGACWWLSI